MAFHVPYEQRRCDQPIYIGFDVPPRRKKHNWTGFWGFLLGIFGIFTAGFLSPLALLISLWGLRKQPRGFATAGVVLGLTGTLIASSIVAAGMRHHHSIIARNEQRANNVKVEKSEKIFATAAEELADFAGDHSGELPDPVSGNMLMLKYSDAWGNPIRFDADKSGASLRSAGADGRIDTTDDVVMPVPGIVNQEIGLTRN